jgi:hypothetical protein
MVSHKPPDFGETRDVELFSQGSLYVSIQPLQPLPN